MNHTELFTEKELSNLEEVMKSIRDRIPEQHMGLVWNSYQRINKDTSPQPCGCASAARYWIQAVNVINTYIKERV